MRDACHGFGQNKGKPGRADAQPGKKRLKSISKKDKIIRVEKQRERFVLIF